MHHFSCFGGPGAVSIKKCTRTRYVVHSGASWVENIDAPFFILRWDWYRYDKKRTRTRYAELVFLLPMGSTGHGVHSGASVA
jgi:hypothetical protein